jgi:site-specific recombinase XerD
VNNSLLEAVVRYRKYLKLPDFPHQEEGDNHRPLIASWNTGQAIGARHINQLLKNIAIKAGELFLTRGDNIGKIEKASKAEKLKHFSAHWIRHLSATHQDEQGIPLKFIKENHRHESEETTRKYVHARDRERHAVMQKLEISFE